MTLGPLEPVQASSGSVSIQIQASPSQLLSEQILTQVNFLINSFMLDVLDMLVIVCIPILPSPEASQFSVRQQLVLMF